MAALFSRDSIRPMGIRSFLPLHLRISPIPRSESIESPLLERETERHIRTVKEFLLVCSIATRNSLVSPPDLQ